MGVPRPVYGRVVTYTSVHGIVNDWILSFTTVVMLVLGISNINLTVVKRNE